MNNKEKILEATLRVFNEKGLKFTMDDIAKELSMSKKTIYTVFRDKETLFYDMVDYCFDNIRESERKIVDDDSLSIVEKIRAILAVLPEGYRDINFEQLYTLEEKYPNTYKHVEERLESGWESTIALLEQGIKEGCIRQIKIPVFKTVFEATLEQFFRRDVLVKNKILYNEALNEVVDILMDGITIH